MGAGVRPAYVGVSGVMSRAEVEAALAAFHRCGRQLMVGVLASEKTVAGLANRYPRRYPKREDIAAIFSDDPHCLNLVHVAVDDTDGVPMALEACMAVGGPHCHGLQLNLRWPTSRVVEISLQHALRRFIRDQPSARLVMQLRSADIDVRLARATAAHEAGATDVLLDASGGRGQDIDVPSTALAVQQIRRACPDLGIGIAGGLCAETVPLVANAIASDISIDAEGKLRDGADGGGNLSLDKVSAYLSAVGEALK